MPSAKTIGNRVAPPRFLLFIALLIIGCVVAVTVTGWQRGIMIGFDIAALGFLAALIGLFNDSTEKMRADAKANDANRATLLGLSFVISVVILVAVASQLSSATRFSAFELGLIVVTLVLVWVVGNAVYALHYAHLYYSADDGGRDATGLQFPGDREPDFADFCHFAFTLGVALQTADICITSAHIRRIVTLHCVAAFFFNLGVLALTVNILGAR
jgi:uncharacterized membrane protein